MTNHEAADELERISRVCTTTKLSIAAMMGANLLWAQETPKGKWIGGELGHCSVCGHEGCASDIWSGCEHTRCPNCGALLELDVAVKHDCPTCKHRDRMPGVYPCNKCVTGVDSDRPSKWEPKEVDNGKAD